MRKPLWLVAFVVGVGVTVWGVDHPLNAPPVPGDPLSPTYDGWLVWPIVGLLIAIVALHQLWRAWRR